MERPVKHKYFDPNITRKGAVLQSHLEASGDDSNAPPLFSLIEFNLSGLCNRTCVFCPRSDASIYPNVNEHIPMELYEKIMGELAEVDYEGMILYSAFGEPLLYKNLEAVLKMSKTYCPKVRIEAVTDGDFVTPDKLQSLFASGLDTLLISLYDGPEQIDKFQDMINKAGLNENQVVLRKRWLPPEEHYGITLSNRSGMVDLTGAGIDALTEPLRRPCFYPFYQLLVNYDGAVLLCPHDWGKKLIVGNLKDNTIHELWNSRVMRRTRRTLANSDRNFAPCNTCDVDGSLMGRPHFDQWLKHYESQASNGG